MIRVELSPEIVRLAQSRTQEAGLSLSAELARIAVEEAITGLDPELGYLVDHEDSLNAIDSVAKAIGINDVVVNGHRIDVRAIDGEGRVSVDRSLIGTPAMSSGTIAVRLEGTEAAEIAAYVPTGSWMGADDDENKVAHVKVDCRDDFDFESTLKTICNKVQIPMDKAVSRLPDRAELEKFVNHRDEIIVARQKQIVTAICAREEIREKLSEIKIDMNRGTVTRVLRATSEWNRRTDEMAKLVSPKFSSMSKEEVKEEITKLGEKYGGQPEAPEFKKALKRKLTLEHATRKLGSPAAAKVKAIADQVAEGKSVADAVKDMVKNNIAVDIALSIKKKRANVEGFVAATTEEIGQAFQQLALQPAYATHSSKDAGVESINEALELLEACGHLEEEELS